MKGTEHLQQHLNQQQQNLSHSSSPSNRDSQVVKKIGNYLLSKSEIIKFNRNNNNNVIQSNNSFFKQQQQGKTIGKGTFGKVKLGIHIPTQECVAIKILEKRMIQGEQDIQSVKSEINILKSVLHPNISQLYEIIETNDCLYLVIEYASNGELFDFIVRKRRLTDQEACLVFAQILNALEYLHEQDICHRDLKPENLLFDHNYELKLVDFGLSKMCTDANQQLYTCCGSPCYASPETISSQPYIGKYVDMWSCGIILFAMLCGYLPFDEDNQTALFKKITSCEYYIPKEISPEASFLIAGLLKKDPKQRLTISQIKNSPFYINQMQGALVKPGIKFGIGLIYVDESIIEQLIIYGIEPSFSRQSVMSNSINSTTATYYLIKNKMSRNFKLVKKQLQIQNQNQNNSSSAINSPKSQSVSKKENKNVVSIPSSQIAVSQTATSSPKNQSISNTYLFKKFHPQGVKKSNNREKSPKQIFSDNNDQKISANQVNQNIDQAQIKLNKKDQQNQIQKQQLNTPDKSETLYFKVSNQNNEQPNKLDNIKSNSQIIKNKQNSSVTQKKQIQLNNSTEEYYNGIQQMKNNYISSQKNHNQVIQNISCQIPKNMDKKYFLLQSPKLTQNNSSIAQQSTLQNTSTTASTKIGQSTQNKNNCQDNEKNDQSQNLANCIVSVSNNTNSNHFSSKKYSQVDITSNKCLRSDYKKKQINDSSQDIKNQNTTFSPKDNSLSVSQDNLLQKQHSSLLQENNRELSKKQKSPMNQREPQNQNPSFIPKGHQQNKFQYKQEQTKKKDVIKTILDSVKNNDQISKQVQTPRVSALTKTTTIDTNSLLFMKRKSVPLYLNNSKQEIQSPKSKEVSTNKNITQNAYSHKNSSPNISNQNHVGLNINQTQYKNQKISKTLNPSLILSQNLKQDTTQIKTEKNCNNQDNQKQNIQQQQSQSQSLLKSSKDSLLYFPEGALTSKKTNKLQIIFNNSTNTKEKALQNNTFHHYSSNLSQNLQSVQSPTQNFSNKDTLNKEQIQPSSAKGSKNLNQFFQSVSKQNQQAQKKNSSPSKQDSASIVNEQTLKKTLGEEDLINTNYKSTNVTSSNLSQITKQNCHNNTNSTCVEATVSTVILNDCESNTYRKNDDHKSQLEEMQLKLSFFQPININDIVKNQKDQAGVTTKIQTNNLLNIINNSALQQLKGSSEKSDKGQNRYSAINQYKNIGNSSQNSIHQNTWKKNFTLNITDSDLQFSQQQISQKPLSAKNEKVNTPTSANLFQKNQTIKKFTKQGFQSPYYNNKISKQKHFLLDF